jgi:hypothetical protein
MLDHVVSTYATGHMAGAWATRSATWPIFIID